MSSPHVAGAAALMLESKPSLNGGQMMERLQNVADPKNWSGNAALGLLDHTFRQGAGMLDIVGAVTANATVAAGPDRQRRKRLGLAHRDADGAQPVDLPASYTVSHVSAVAAGPNNIGTGTSYAPTGIFDAPATVTLSTTSLTVPSRGTATVDVTIAANAALPDRSLYGGYIRFTPVGTGTPMSVPYAGFKGDYQSTVVLTPTANGFPWLAKLGGGNLTNQPAARPSPWWATTSRTSCSTSTTSRAR